MLMRKQCVIDKYFKFARLQGGQVTLLVARVKFTYLCRHKLSVEQFLYQILVVCFVVFVFVVFGKCSNVVNFMNFGSARGRLCKQNWVFF